MNTLDNAILRSSPASPFGRKVRMAAAVLGLSDRIQLDNADTMDPADTVRQQNPLGKIPVLVLGNGQCLFDSKVIVEWLAAQVPGNTWFAGDALAQAKVRTDLHLCDGVTDAALLLVYEGRYREPHQASPKWQTHQAEKIERALAHLSSHLPVPDVTQSPAAIALVCALGYLDFRKPVAWREAHPALVRWFDQAQASHPCVAETAPV